MTERESIVPNGPAWLAGVAERVRRWQKSGLGPNWIVAVSGGSDSVGLLVAFDKLAPSLGLRLSIAHFDHGGEADDGAFVAELAGRLGHQIDLGTWVSRADSARFNEAKAREARYAWLAEVAKTRCADAVAVGHTKDDQAETILFRILRGTGPQGVSGIPRRRILADSVALVRPFLDISRAEIQAYLAGLGQCHRDDPANFDRTRARSRLRHEILPTLKSEFNPKVVEALVRLGKLVAAEHREFHRDLEKLAVLATLEARSDRLVFDRLTLQLACSSFARAELIRHAWRTNGWPEAAMNAARWRRLARAAIPGRTPAAFSIGAGVEVETTDRQLILRYFPKRSTPSGSPILLALPGFADWEDARIVAVLEPGEPRDETIDLEAIEPPLFVSSAEIGDRFDPLGMEGKHVLLSDFLRGRRIPKRERGAVPIVRDQKGIVWVVGQRIAERVKVRETTKRTFGLRREPTCD